MTPRDGLATIFAPISGIVVSLEDVPDPAFAQRLAGDGVAIDPLEQRVVAPCDARVLQVHRAGHALTLSAFGLEILIHVGLDTVKLNGKGFKARVKAGAQVRKGDELMTFDADYIATNAVSLMSPVLVTNMDRVTSIRPQSGKVRAGQLLLEIGTGAVVAADGLDLQRDAVRSAPIAITHEPGCTLAPPRGRPTLTRHVGWGGESSRGRPENCASSPCPRARECGNGRGTGRRAS